MSDFYGERGHRIRLIHDLIGETIVGCCALVLVALAIVTAVIACAWR